MVNFPVTMLNVHRPREPAAARETAGVNQHTEPSGNFPEGSTGQTRDKIGAFAGVSGRTVEKIAAVVEAAEREPDGRCGRRERSHMGPLLLDVDGIAICWGKAKHVFRLLNCPNQRPPISR
jgi:hypothetical protein